jgi:hypothetical protein
MKYFFVWGRNDPKSAVAYAPEHLEIHSEIKEVKERKGSPVFTINDGELRDYLPDNIGWQLCSAKIKAIIDAYRLNDDTFEWYPITIKRGDEESQYYALWFPSMPEILDPNETSYLPLPRGGKYVRRAAFRANILEKMSIAALEENSRRWIVASDVKEAIKQAGCTGISFEEAYVSGKVKRRSRKLDLSLDKTHLQTSSVAQLIPEDLRSFLESRKKLKYASSVCEPGQVLLKKLSQLEMSFVRIEKDQSTGTPEYYDIPAISLTDECEGGYDPEFILLWLTEEKKYGTYDTDHGILWVFHDVTWLNIVKNPVPYLNAQWEVNSEVATLFDQFLNYRTMKES